MTELKIGLRFDRNQAPKLRELGDRIRSGQMDTHHAGVFDDAATAAENGEPLIVVCQHSDEAVMMAEGYVLYGIRRPSVEQLGA